MARKRSPLALFAVLLAAQGAQAQPIFIPIGDLAGGDPFSFGWAISPDGNTAVGASGSANSGLQDDAFRFLRPAGPIRTLTTDPASNDLAGGNFRSTAFGVSADGAIVVGASAYNGLRTHAFVWSAASPTALVDLGNIAGQTPPLPAVNDISAALAVSDNGNIIVGRGVNSSTLTNEACFWTNGAPGATRIGDLAGGSFLSIANGVSGNGLVIVGEGQSASGREAFRWTQAGGMVGLGDASGGGFESSARDASTDGSVIVGYCTTAAGLEAARWAGSNYVLRPLGDLPGGAVASEANACSADGRVIVGVGDAGRQTEVFPGFFVAATDAFVWDPRHGMRRLADVLGAALPGGYFLDEANGVSADGTAIVGTATNFNGESEAFVAVIPHFCAADTNDSGSVTVQDIFDYLTSYFSSVLMADINGDGLVSVQDIFDFLAAYFSGC